MVRRGSTVRVRQRASQSSCILAVPDDGVECDKRDCDVGRMGSDAALADPEDGVPAVEPFDGRATRSRPAFVAGRDALAEVGTASALTEVCRLSMPIFRSCSDAPRSGASETAGNRSLMIGVRATSLIRASAPIRIVPCCSSPSVASGSALMSTRRSLFSTPRRSKSIFVVPPRERHCPDRHRRR
jgi:hypothetical protein